jgi:hypothetical protein
MICSHGLGGPTFNFDCGPGRKTRAVEGVTNRRKLGRIGHLVVDRHLQQFTGHPVDGFLDALPRFSFHLRSTTAVSSWP